MEWWWRWFGEESSRGSTGLVSSTVPQMAPATARTYAEQCKTPAAYRANAHQHNIECVMMRTGEFTPCIRTQTNTLSLSHSLSVFLSVSPYLALNTTRIFYGLRGEVLRVAHHRASTRTRKRQYIYSSFELPEHRAAGHPAPDTPARPFIDCMAGLHGGACMVFGWYGDAATGSPDGVHRRSNLSAWSTAYYSVRQAGGTPNGRRRCRCGKTAADPLK